jgi:hypothetical protein
MSRGSLPCLLSVVFALAISACDSATGPGQPVQFRIRESATSAEFIIEISSPSTIAQAETLRQSHEARWIVGTPQMGDGGFNAPWTWSLAPGTISFAEVTIEACQATAAMVDQDLAYWIELGQLCLHGTIEARGP